MSEDIRIRKAAVIGAGVMGSAIAAHFANAGIKCLLLDIRPDKATDEEKKLGLGPDDPIVANRFARKGLERALKSRPASFYVRKNAKRITVGNLDDDLEKLTDADWVVEVVVENLEIKKQLFEKITPHLKEGAVLTTNTSGLSVGVLSKSLPPERRGRFLVTHFFNPPRYLKLLEIVPAPETDPAVTAAMARIGEDVLGKGIVLAKDSPNFVANRIGAYAMFHAVNLMREKKYNIVEVDKLTGKAIGRPKSATFRTADLVGLDTLIHVARNMHENLPGDPERELFAPPDFVSAMIEKGWLGSKSGQGFYKKVVIDGKKEIHVLDPDTMKYVPQPKAAFPSLEMAKTIDDAGERIRTLVSANDRAGEFLRENLLATLRYAANALPEICDDIVSVDNALRWGFGWELGPFQIWDALGVRKTCEMMEASGAAIPPVAKALLDSGGESFYRKEEGAKLFFDPAAGKHEPVPVNPRILILADMKERQKTVIDDPDASLIDIGDDVACLEFRTKMNTIGPGIIEMIDRSLDEVEKNWRGLVIGNNADNFSVGANLLLVLNEIDDDNFDEVEWMADRFQKVNQRIRYSERPVVTAPHGLTLGGGCEVTLAANRVCAAAETYIGLVEVGAGVIPAGGGCKELIRRIDESVPEDAAVDLFPLVRRIFETVGMAKVATSGDEAKEFGFLAAEDRTVINGDYLIDEAKRTVLALDLAGFTPGRPRDDIRVIGAPGLAAIRTGLFNMAEAGFITEYDGVVGDKLAVILCGGELSGARRVSEQYLLDLEREAFMSLCGDPRTQARMEHILKTGKPLRN